MKCPKCGSEAQLTHERREGASRAFHTDMATGETHFPSIDDILADRQIDIFGSGFDRVYECVTHGEFGVLKPAEDGEPARVEFVEPDTWVEGPNGEKLFRL
jgi:hypothetical protein